MLGARSGPSRHRISKILVVDARDGQRAWKHVDIGHCKAVEHLS